MGNLIDIQLQIEKLQKQASDIRAKEFDRTVGEILGQMQAFGITLKDLQQAMGKFRRAKARVKTTGKKNAKKPMVKKTSPITGRPVEAKYRGPKGETWSGRGSMPKWLVALVSKGKAKEDFAINSR
ncbi:MAG: H-NS histone family protein [Hylemonella sp.]|nr:H-NS histone family protein [Hylemonella sp.]